MLQTVLAGRPVLLCAASAGTAGADQLGRALLALTGERVTLTSPRQTNVYSFATEADLGPFAGVTLSERRPRIIAAAAEDQAAAETVIASPHGATFLRWRGRDRLVFVSLVPLLDDGPSVQ